MTAIIGAVLLMLVVVMSVALILGAPLGEFTLGGRFKVFPAKLRLVLVTQLLLQVFFAIVLLQLGHIYPNSFTQMTDGKMIKHSNLIVLSIRFSTDKTEFHRKKTRTAQT